MEAIKTKALTKKYGEKTAVDKLELTVHQGEIYALLGVNGAGKSTTIKILSCLVLPTDGDAELNGFSIHNKAGEVKKIINVSPQETAVAPKLSVRENLEFIASIYGAKHKQAVKNADEMIEALSMQDVAKSRAGTLSGGWQRRLSIAMALISEPKILFLDEPTLGLDVLARRELWHVIEKLKSKMTIILTTHYLEEAEALADRIGIMAKGRLLAEGTASALMEKAETDNFEEAFIKISEGDVL